MTLPMLRAVVAIIRDSDGLVLSVSRRNRPGNLSLPGGKVDFDESPLGALIREVYEETGVKVLHARPLLVRTVPGPNYYRTSFYLVDQWTGEASQQEEGIEVQWVEPKDLMTNACSFAYYNRKALAALEIKGNTFKGSNVVGA